MKMRSMIVWCLVGMLGLAAANAGAAVTFSVPIANDVVVMVGENGRISALGGEGADVAYDKQGRIIRVGNTQVLYGKSGEVKSIGMLGVSYDKHGRLKLLGTVPVQYAKDGKIQKIGTCLIEYNKDGTFRRVTGLKGIRIFFEPD